MPRKPSSQAFAAITRAALTDSRGLRALAREAKLSSMKLSRWTRGEEPAALADLERVAAALGLKIVVQGADPRRQ